MNKAKTGTGIAAQHLAALNIKSGPLSDKEVEQALAIGRAFNRIGTPVIAVAPALDEGGRWQPTGGIGKTGYWLPKDWQESAADPANIDEWQPGYCLMLICGHRVDVIDVDPRNGGDDSASELRGRGGWPHVYGKASTPSGGTHDVVKSLRVRKGNPLPGLDVQAGDNDGNGRGFVFLAPTLRKSKSDGKVRPYRWALKFDADAFEAAAHADDSGRRLADMIDATRNGSRKHESLAASQNGDAFLMRPGTIDLAGLIDRGIPDGELHDDTLARAAYKLCAGGVDDDVAYSVWRAIVDKTIPTRVSEPFGRSDFDRHWWGATKALAKPSAEQGDRKQIETIKAHERSRRAALRELEAEDFAEPDEAGSLADQLDEPTPEPEYLVDGVFPRRGIVQVNAQWKAGKTTLVSVNLALDLVSGEPFLGEFAVDFNESCIGIWNLEVGAPTLQRWLASRDVSRDARARVFPMHLRGKGVDLLAPPWQEWAIGWLRAHDVKVWIIDPLSKLLVSENDAAEFNVFWKRLEQIAVEAGVDLTVLVHHTGHGTGDADALPRARGTSAMQGNPDAIYSYRHGGQLGSSPPSGDTRRYFSGFGRDVDLPEITVDFNPDTKRLSLVRESAGRDDDRLERAARRAAAAVAACHGSPVNTGDLKAALRPMRSELAGAAISRAVARGWLAVEPGRNGAKLYRVTDDDSYFFEGTEM